MALREFDSSSILCPVSFLKIESEFTPAAHPAAQCPIPRMGSRVPGYIETWKMASSTATFAIRSEKTGQTIGAITIFVGEKPNDVVIISGDKKKDQYQAIAREPGQLKFLIENFTKKDTIKIDVYYKNELQNVKDPGSDYTINKINEIRARQKVVITADQSADSTTLLLDSSNEKMPIGGDGSSSVDDGLTLWFDVNYSRLGTTDYGKLIIERTLVFSKFVPPHIYVGGYEVKPDIQPTEANKAVLRHGEEVEVLFSHTKEEYAFACRATIKVVFGVAKMNDNVNDADLLPYFDSHRECREETKNRFGPA